MSNLPEWKAADKVYTRAYGVLARMAQHGHATPARGRRYLRNGQATFINQGHASDTMNRLIEALNGGDEETIKGLLLQHEYSIYW